MMKVQLLNDSDKIETGSIIEIKDKNKLPSLQEGWRFNFRSNAKKLNGSRCFIIVNDSLPDEIQGSLVFYLREKVEPYMAYIEIAPHNRGMDSKYKNVAGCLIAYACMLSFAIEDPIFKGFLAFDVIEKTEVETVKLMAVYSTRYKAKRIADTTSMLIEPNDGIDLIKKYLNR